jgi:hypothetical protein
MEMWSREKGKTGNVHLTAERKRRDREKGRNVEG